MGARTASSTRALLSPDVGNFVQDITVGTVDQQYAVVDPDPAAVARRPGQAIGAIIIHHIAHEIARQVIARMPAVPPVLPRHAVITESRREEEIEAYTGIIPESVISAPPVAVALPHRVVVPVLIARLPLPCLVGMLRRHHRIAARRLDLWRRLGLRLTLKLRLGLSLTLKLGLGLDLGPERASRTFLPLLPLETLRLLPFRPGLGLDRCLNRGGLHWRLNRRRSGRLGCPRLFSLLSLLSLRPVRPGLSLDRSRGRRSGRSGRRSGRSGRRRGRSGRRLDWRRSSAAMSVLALSPVGTGLLLLGPVIVFAAAPVVRLRQCGRRARDQNGNSGRQKTRFHEITQSIKGSGLANPAWRASCIGMQTG